MVKKLGKDGTAGKTVARKRKLRTEDSQVTETRLVHWVESDQLSKLGHGVQFVFVPKRAAVWRKFAMAMARYGKVVAFLEEFYWLQRNGGLAPTVRLLRICPPGISADHWSEIIESTKEAVLVFLSSEDNLKYSFRHGPIGIITNT